MENVDCHAQDYVINFEQFEWTEYQLNTDDKSKKKLNLNDKSVTLKEFVQYFHEKVETFTVHHFNHKHTDVMTDSLLELLRDHELMIVQDFCENYDFLLPDEPQSVYWTIQQGTIYSVVTPWCDNKKIVDDHFVFICDNCTYDSSFFE